MIDEAGASCGLAMQNGGSHGGDEENTNDVEGE